MRIKLIFVLALFVLAIPIQTYSQDWRPQHLVGMDYPRLALQARVEGEIRLECTLNNEGRVMRTRVSNNPSDQKGGSPLLAEAVAENAMNWTFVKLNPESPSDMVNLVYKFNIYESINYYAHKEFVFEYPNSIFVSSEALPVEH